MKLKHFFTRYTVKSPVPFRHVLLSHSFEIQRFSTTKQFKDVQVNFQLVVWPVANLSE